MTFRDLLHGALFTFIADPAGRRYVKDGAWTYHLAGIEPTGTRQIPDQLTRVHAIH